MLEAPETTYAPKTLTGRMDPLPARERARRGGVLPAAGARRELGEDFARPAQVGEEVRDEGYARPRARATGYSGLRLRLRGGVPASIAGRVFAAAVVIAGLAGFTAVIWEARSMLLEDPRLVIEASSSVQITGNEHLTKAQLLSVFGGDVDRNILTVPLTERRAELERLPWVEHATVMRLLPNQLRVAIVERTPVAFVRQGSRIGLVDRGGVLLDLAAGGGGAAASSTGSAHYSFPVLTGILAQDPPSVRAARMALYERFLRELDAGTAAGKARVADSLSEVDLSSPEDVKALLPSGPGGSGGDILVHFGHEDFLHRYERFEERLPEWKAQYPRLASVDMRYERQVVLEMAPGAVARTEGGGKADGAGKAAGGKAGEKQPFAGVRASGQAAGGPHAGSPLHPVAKQAQPGHANPVQVGGR